MNTIKEPPKSFWGTLSHLGPSMILSASIVGSGELIMTTTLGARAGFVALWVIILSCLVKVTVQLEFGKHAINSGETSMQALSKLPGPKILRAHWTIWMWFIVQLMIVVQVDPYFTTANTVVYYINNPQAGPDSFDAALTPTDNNQDNDGTGLIGVDNLGVAGQTAGGHMGGNACFEGAEYLGNLLDTDSGVLETSGYLTSPVVNSRDGTIEYDIDWYYFEVRVTRRRV